MTIPFTFAINLPSSLDSSLLGEFAASAIRHLGSVSVSVYDHQIDGGDLGDISIDLEDVEVDLSDVLCEYTISGAIEQAESRADYASETVEQKITLTQVREAYCKDHGCSPYEFLAAVGEEIAIAAMNERDRAVRHELRQEVERAQASVEADKLVVEQSIQGRNKAQELYGEQAAQMREAVKLLSQAGSQLRDPSGGMSFMSKDEQLRDTTSKQIRDFLTKAVWYEADETETETETEAPTNSTDAEA